MQFIPTMAENRRDNERLISRPSTSTRTIQPRIDNHKHRRQVENPVWRSILLWHPIASHAILSILLVSLMLFYLPGYQAMDDGAGSLWQLWKRKFCLRVNDVTTIISAAVVPVRLSGSAWTAGTVWRCAFSLLEQSPDGLKISQLSNMLAWRAPMHRPVGMAGWSVTLILYLLLPQSLVAPLLTGAVGWSSSWELTTEVQAVYWGASGARLFETKVKENNDQSLQPRAAPDDDNQLQVTNSGDECFLIDFCLPGGPVNIPDDDGEYQTIDSHPLQIVPLPHVLQY